MKDWHECLAAIAPLTALFNNMQGSKFKAQPLNAFFVASVKFLVAPPSLLPSAVRIMIKHFMRLFTVVSQFKRGVCKTRNTPGTPRNIPEHPRNTTEHPRNTTGTARNSPEHPRNTPGTSHNTPEHPIMPRNTLNTARNTLEHRKFWSAVRPLTHRLSRGPPKINEDFRIFSKTFADHSKTK